ncbi:hypothetical protein LTR80_007428, partial [Exophiala xenobiotica]
SDHDRSESEQATLLADTGAPQRGDHVYPPPCHERPNRLRHAAEAQTRVPSICFAQKAPADVSQEFTQKARRFRAIKLTFLSDEGKTKMTEATMDTGAEGNCIPWSLVERLRPSFEPEADGPMVRGIGGKELELTSMGKICFTFRFACDTEGEYRDAAEFYVLADEQLPEPHRALLSVACTEELDHLQRRPCASCDPFLQTG